MKLHILLKNRCGVFYMDYVKAFIVGGIIWELTGGPQAVFLIGGLAVVAAGFLAGKMKEIQTINLTNSP